MAQILTNDNGYTEVIGNPLDFNLDVNRPLLRILKDLDYISKTDSAFKKQAMEHIVTTIKSNFIPWSWYLPDVPTDFNNIMGDVDFVCGSPEAIAHAKKVRLAIEWAIEVQTVLEQHAEALEGIN